MYVIATVSCPNFHFSVSPHVPFLNLLFEQIAIPTSISMYLVFTCKSWLRYSRKQAWRCLRTRLNIELNFPPKLQGVRSRLYRRRFLQVNTRWNSYLVRKEIEKKGHGERLVGKLSPRSTQCTPLHRSLISIFSSKIAKLFLRLK